VFGTRGGVAVIGGLVALAIAAAPAQATTDRADYAAQANAVCKSGNAQQKQLYEGFEQAIDRINAKEKKVHGRKRAKLESKIETLFNQIDDQSLAIADATHSQLKLIAAAPGDEQLVADWLTTAQTSLDLIRQVDAIEARIEKLFNAPFKGHSIRAFRKRDRTQKRLEQQANALYAQLDPLNEKYVEQGTELGATYCVTGASGSSSSS
jgi:hypothetical protein